MAIGPLGVATGHAPPHPPPPPRSWIPMSMIGWRLTGKSGGVGSGGLSVGCASDRKRARFDANVSFQHGIS